MGCGGSSHEYASQEDVQAVQQRCQELEQFRRVAEGWVQNAQLIMLDTASEVSFNDQMSIEELQRIHDHQLKPVLQMLRLQPSRTKDASQPALQARARNPHTNRHALCWCH